MDETRVPKSLRTLVSWQAGRVATIGSRLTAEHMPSESRADYAVLASLVEQGALSQADLGRILGLDRNNVNGIVTRLEAADQIERRTDPSDRRRNIVTVTESGRAHFAMLQEHADAVQNELLTGLSAAERQQLIDLLDRVLAAHPALPA